MTASSTVAALFKTMRSLGLTDARASTGRTTAPLSRPTPIVPMSPMKKDHSEMTRQGAGAEYGAAASITLARSCGINYPLLSLRRTHQPVDGVGSSTAG